MALEVKNLPANAGNIRDVGSISGSGRSPGGGMATHSSILAWRIPMDRGAWGAIVTGCTVLDMTKVTKHTCTHMGQKSGHELVGSSAQFFLC